MPDYIPPADDAKILWLTNLKTKIGGYAVALGITAARVTQITAWCDDLIAAINAAAQAKSAWLSSSAAQRTQEATSLGGIRGEVALWKPQPGMTDAIEADLKIVGTSTPFNPDTFKTKLTATVVGDHVKLTFVKGHSDGVNFYWRKQGETAWKFLSRDTNSPYNDHTPLTTPGVHEVRECIAYGVLNDQQIGQPSDIVSATFGG